MRITSRGRITIPWRVRRELGLEPGDEVEVVVRDGRATIVSMSKPAGRGRRIVEALRGRGEVTLSTNEIMAMTRGD